MLKCAWESISTRLKTLWTLPVHALSVSGQTLIFLEDVCPASECRIHYHQRPSICRTTRMKPSVFAICTLFVNYSWANTVPFFLSLARSLAHSNTSHFSLFLYPFLPRCPVGESCVVTSSQSFQHLNKDGDCIMSGVINQLSLIFSWACQIDDGAAPAALHLITKSLIWSND